MNKRDLERHTTQHDIDDVTWEVDDKCKRKDRVVIILHTESRFTLMKIWLTLKMIVEKMDLEFGYLENADEDNKQ